jgi:asparagine synthase (glutamine-hydrolysing)
VSSVFGTDHHELELSFLDDSVDLGELMWCMDEPLADLSALGFEALSKLASEHVTVGLWPGKGPTSCWAATRSTGRRRW